MQAAPDVLRCAHLVEGEVLDPEEVALLEIGGCQAPPALQIPIEAVAEDVSEGPVRLLAEREPDRGVARVALDGERQCFEDTLRELVVTDSWGGGLLGCAVQRSTEESHLHEIVEVTGLERGVLPVVGEAQNIARGRR
ncbi:hypothetical protein A7Q09_05340 [Methylacidiphilum sp. Yel]|nr:hypothetical protein A7Q09_05340 [Methylacidiphilum sp. Yel]